MKTDFIRSFFPGLQSEWTFMDNAGGSQILQPVLDRILEFYLTSNVQLGATYQPSVEATGRVERSQSVMARYINAASPEEIIMGSSTSLLLRILASNLGKWFPRGSEIIVTDCDHEANIGCWRELEKSGFNIKTWKTDPVTLMLNPADLERLLSRQTRLVAFTHASNILGTVNPIRQIVKLIHSCGALACADGVAYAPHRMIDVQDWNVDFYVFSFYKTYGPHYAMLYGKKDILLGLPGNNHYFIGKDQSPYKFQPGNVNFEFSWGMTGLPDYFDQLFAHHFPESGELSGRERLAKVFGMIQEHENGLSHRLRTFLRTKPGVRIIGQETASENRVPTISFVVGQRDSESIVREVDKHKIGIRFGDFYARRLIEALGLAAQNGVVRVSMVHYNTVDEVDRLIRALDNIF
ncbi:MAG: cysteine desulfurase-like protein [Bacteroidetes bacterium GWF2_49_14]|nr:MAG: cysteine desulfurase-like protein [Bacteroidetes bacterium GWF2_49_14]HBB93221.1 cysteine desulfurase-like protein [Bacteroidales bacterium]